MERRIEECLSALEGIAGDIFGCAEASMIDIGDALREGSARDFLRRGGMADIENDLIHVIGLAERGLRIMKEFKEAASEGDE